MIAIISLLVLIVAGVMLVWYIDNKSQSKKEEKEEDYTIYPSMVENVLSNDFQRVIKLHRDEKIKWFTTIYELNDFLDSGEPLHITSLSNIFQYMSSSPDEKSTDVYVYDYHHTSLKSSDIIKTHDFWVEDNSLDVLEARIPFKEALDRLMATNYKKPHSKQCVLRNQVGPKKANAQYIFGNTEDVIFVDSITGNVSNRNPFFEN